MAEIRPVKNSCTNEYRPNVIENSPLSEKAFFSNCVQIVSFSRSRLPLGVFMKIIKILVIRLINKNRPVYAKYSQIIIFYIDIC